MDVKLNPMNNAFHTPSNGIGKINTKYSVGEVKNNVLTFEPKLEKSDKVSISHQATQSYEIHKLTKQIMKEINSVDMDQKVEEIKQQIQNGTYNSSPDKIAEAVLSHLIK